VNLSFVAFGIALCLVDKNGESKMNFNHRKIPNLIRIGMAFCTAMVLILTSTMTATGTTPYTVIDIGVLDSSSATVSSYANDVNNQGQVVGYSSTANGNRAFLWDSTKGLQDLGVLGSTSSGTSASYANGINDEGEVVGYSSTANGDRAFLWDSTKGLQDLGVLGSTSFGTSFSRANAINKEHQVVGYSSTANGDRAFLWDSTKGLQDLGVLGSNGSLTNSRANDINNIGQVVGFSTQSISGQGAFLWDSANGLKDLGALSNPSPGGRSANGINDNSQVVGGANAPSVNRNDPAFIWDSTNGMQALEFSPAYFNIANDINNSGQIVGYVNLRYRPSFAALWDSTTRKITNLNTLIEPNSGWSLVEARGINDRGEIVGYGTYNNQTRAFLLQPTNVTPAPAP
jgi:probable HAF family extracellular repeat protein